MAEALLALEDIEIHYGSASVLRIPSLAVLPGEVLALMGPNGAGKSTLIRVIGLLERPERGRIYFRGVKVAHGDAPALRKRIATVFQEPLLLNSTVYENAALGLKLRGLDRKAIDRRVQPWLERLGISHLVQRQARSLSGGEAQRTSLVRALALDPELLLLDEPFSALDPPTRDGLILDLQAILRETEITAVFVTHDRDEAFMLGDRVGVLMRGELLQIASATEIFTHPVSEEVAGFVGIDSKFSGEVETACAGRSRVRFPGGSAEVIGELQPGERVLLCVRSEEITLSPPSVASPPSDSCNRLSGRVTKITPWGFHYRVAVDCGGQSLIALISRSSFLALELTEGAEVIASFQASAIHVIRQ